MVAPLGTCLTLPALDVPGSVACIVLGISLFLATFPITFLVCFLAFLLCLPGFLTALLPRIPCIPPFLTTLGRIGRY